MRIAVITGASSGIGKEFVYAVDREENLDEIWVIARREERLAALEADCGHKLRILPYDLAREESITAYRDLLDKERPQIHLLINSAGCGIFGPFRESDPDRQINSLKVNLLALVAMCRVSLPYMSKGDSIINVGSNSAWQPVPYQSVYGAGKSAVLSFSRAIGRELKPEGIHVMCVCPGWIRTEFQQEAEHDAYIRYVDRWYEARDVVEQAMKDLRKKKKVSILGAPVRRQVRLVKHLPVDLVMNIWCRQQGIR